MGIHEETKGTSLCYCHAYKTAPSERTWFQLHIYLLFAINDGDGLAASGATVPFDGGRRVGDVFYTPVSPDTEHPLLDQPATGM